MTSTDTTAPETGIEPEIDVLDMTEEAQGIPANAVLAIGGLGVLLLAFVAFSALTGGVGMVKLLMLVVGIGATYFAVKQISAAETGQLLAVKEKFAALSGRSKERQPSVRIGGPLMDI